MPRPLNWIRGEGTTKIQRGLGDQLVISSDPLAQWNAAQNSGNNAAVLPPCSSLTTPAGFVGPMNCDPTNGGVNYTPYGDTTQSFINEVASLSTALDSQGSMMKYGLIGAAVLVGILFLKGR